MSTFFDYFRTYHSYFINYNTRLVFNNNFYIIYSSFSNIISNSNGGAISCQSESKALIECSNFWNCSSNQGGSIYFSHFNSEIILKQVHGINSYASNYLFSYQYTKTNGYNNLILCSIYKSFNPNCDYLISLNYGYQNISSCNFSNNYNKISTSLELISGSQSYLNFNNFFNSTSQFNCLMIRNNNKYEILSSNFISNNQTLLSYGLIYILYSSNIYILNSIFLNNTGNLINSINSNPIQIQSCNIFPQISLSSVILINVSFLITSTYNINNPQCFFQINHFIYSVKTQKKKVFFSLVTAGLF